MASKAQHAAAAVITRAIMDWLGKEIDRTEQQMVAAAKASEDAGDRVMRMQACANRLVALDSASMQIGRMPLTVVAEALEASAS